MPALGKSGTLRMCCLRSIQPSREETTTYRTGSAPHLPFDREAPVTARFLVVHRYLVHAGAARAGAERTLDARDGVGLSFDQCFDAAVRQIPHPSCNAFAAGGVLGEPAESDTLNPAADDESPCDAHREERPIICGSRRNVAGVPPGTSRLHPRREGRERLAHVHRNVERTLIVGEMIVVH